MRKLSKRVGLGLLVFLFFYLLGSFYNVNFNIAKWDETSRFAVCLFGGFASLVFATFPFSEDL